MPSDTWKGTVISSLRSFQADGKRGLIWKHRDIVYAPNHDNSSFIVSTQGNVCLDRSWLASDVSLAGPSFCRLVKVKPTEKPLFASAPTVMEENLVLQTPSAVPFPLGNAAIELAS